MITDINSLDSGTILNADICIIGGGAAAIAMAREFAGSKLEICILEGGGLNLEAEHQNFAAGETSGIPYFNLDESHYCLFGGSTFRWGARSAAMKPIDFEAREWVDLSGWPIQLDALKPYYDRLPEMLDLHEPFDIDADVWSHFQVELPAFDQTKFSPAAFQFGRTLLLGEEYRPQLKQADNIHIYLHARATNIQSNQDGSHIEQVDVKTLKGKTFTVKARTYVLACGGIDNARLLLLSDTVNPAGLCNSNDLVGRYFMEHPTVSGGIVRLKEWQSLHDVFSPGLLGGRLVETGLGLSEKLQNEGKCLNAVVSTKLNVSRDATQALREIIWNFRHRKTPGSVSWYANNAWLRQRLGTILRNPFSIVSNLVRHVIGKPKRFKVDSVYLEIRTEQAPNPDSRVTLSDQTDSLGQRRAHLHWAMTRLDKHTMQVAAKAFEGELERLGVGELEQADWLSDEALTWDREMVGGHHHMGTTRMSDGEKTGIVDVDCKAHGIDNLYIAGSSVFPTAGFVNPTSTLLALAMRLADHLKREGA